MPPTLIEASKAGSATDLRTSIWAARWKTTRAAASAAGAASAARVADVELDQLGAGRERPVEVLAPPVERSSTTVTSSPRASSASTRFEPMKPAPPVTKDFSPAAYGANLPGM